MDLLLILALTCLGAVIGLAIGAIVPQAPVAFLMLTVCAFGAVGLITAYVLLYLAKQRSTIGKAASIKKPDVKTANQTRQFAQSLARFAQHSKQANARSVGTQESAMTFWTSLTEFPNVLPKSRLSIRQILGNIRRILRGG